MLEQMQTEGFSPDAVTYICSLKSCSTAGNLERGRYMHMEIVKCELDMAVSVSNSLVCMYAKCGSLAEAEDAFDRLPQHNIISWTALLVGYAEHGIDDKAIMCFDQMQSRGLCLDAMTFIGILKAVIRQKDRMRGQDVHLLIIKEGFEADLFIGNSLIDFYSQSGLLHEALDILQEMPSRDVISWNSLIAGLLENEAAEEALMCLERMQKDHLVPDAITLMCGLRACSLLGDLVSGQQLHGCITKQGYDSDLYVGNSLIDMHAKCGMLIDACHSFDGLPMRDVASWTARISGLCDHGFGVEALDAFEDMQKEGVMPNVATYICCLKACASIRAIESGQVLYIRITKEGLDTFPPLGSSIVDMYAKCGILLDAQAIFEGLSTKDELSYNALLWGYAEHGYKVEAFKCLGCMTLEGILPDVITYGSILKACGSSGNFCYGQDMHTEIIQRGFERDALIADLLVDLYAKCGLHAEARSLCKGFSFQGVIPWNMLISGYVEHGDSEEALKCLVQMGEEGIHPDKITCVMCLKACGNIGSLYKGRRLHAYIIEEKLEADLFISNTLVDMYAKCGLLAEAKGLFDDLPDIDVVSWNVLVAGYASQGESCYVSILLERMGQAGMTLNGTTIVSILTVSNHSGLIEECVQYFEGLNRRLAHCLTIDHYNCMIDLLGRAGQLEQVHMMSEQMPFHPNLVTWSSVLSSSRKNGYINFGIWAFNSSLCLNQSEASVYVSMANMCVDTCAENVSSKVLLCLQIDELMQL
ncbi:hypothetical protein KP509_30G076000 [Ceratopteris richardii]|nr:hypothetical protein KP509_30G076000 [Ceratopteris richardii]